MYPPVKTKMHPYPESKARQKSTCDGSIDACEVRCIQGVLSQSKNLKNIKINKWTENKLIEVMSEGYSRNDEKIQLHLGTCSLQVQARPRGAQGAKGAVQAGSAQV